jgi:porphobilinogen synthase
MPWRRLTRDFPTGKFQSMKLQLLRRPRRNRSRAALRRMVRETTLLREDLIWPLFFHGGTGNIEIASMPGVLRHDLASLETACRQACDLGIPAVALFPCIDSSDKDAEGSLALQSGNILFRALRRLRLACPDLILITDVALDPYTNHGHDGILSADGSCVVNDATVEKLCQLAALEAEAGADVVAPSDMMDGRVEAIRRFLDSAGHENTLILSYAAKYASAYYGPFRDAVGSKQGKDAIDKKSYQMDPANGREAILETGLDELEGADWLMVKPAGPYLDIIRSVRETSPLPLAAYQVSGEYAQIHAAARLGWLDYEKVRDESLIAIKRAGADLILTYFAPEVAGNLREG